MELITDKIKEIMQSDDNLGYDDPLWTFSGKLRKAIHVLAEEIDALKNIK